MIIRVLLLLSLSLIGYFAFLQRRRLPVHILLVFTFLATAAGMVIFPGATNWMAARVGVGRGVDLVNYLVDVSLLFIVLHYYTKFSVLQQQLTTLTREVALLRRHVEDRGASPSAGG